VKGWWLAGRYDEFKIVVRVVEDAVVPEKGK
jgi:hypothetical protein